jgi:thymidylate synthase
MNNLDLQYQNLLQDILDNGIKKKDRTGTGTLSVFGRQIRHKMGDGFPLLTTKKMYFKGIITELLWFLRGDTNIRYLVNNNCHIWDGDAYKNYVNTLRKTHSVHYEPMGMPEFIERIKTDDEFAKKWGELGPIYGKQWRRWQGWMDIPETHYLAKGSLWYDQIGVLIYDLKTNPDSRRLMVSAWNVAELDKMVLPPCHYGFQVWTRELSWEEQVQWVMKNTDVELENVYIVEEIAKDSTPKRAISLMWNQRSVDTFLGLPFNIASYGLLLEIVAKAVNMVPDELIGNLGDVHLYSNHVDQARAQIGKRLTLEERRSMVSQEMFNQIYTGGGPETLSHSECDQWDIPTFIYRESYKLPKLKHLKTDAFYKSLSESTSLFTHLEPDDFKIEKYKSHPAIKAPLSN